jgi:hypothetical protein
MDVEALTYYHRRERAERTAAKESLCPEARRVHRELAAKYAAQQAKAAVSRPPK